MRCSRKFLKVGYVRDYIGFMGLNSLKGVI